LKDGKLKYFLNFNQEEYEDDISNKFNYLKGEEISIWDAKRPIPIGTIAKLNYPNIIIEMDTVREEICTPSQRTAVCCTLKGERDKIKRLSQTVDIIFSVSKQKILNEKLRGILMDSSRAETFPGDITRTEDYEKAISEIESSLLSKNINFRQKEAIGKCLLAKDFFLIQGPPGTGKSTAIAELIWQHIRSNISLKKTPYRILVTSETNLAVDNALDKLRSKSHLLIKPIRFGSDDKLEKEGRRFSIETLKQWVLFGDKELDADKASTNILQDWISQIINRVTAKVTTDSKEVSEKWLTYLNNANQHLRSLLFKKYLENANVFGATCSSIGKENSEQKFTRFFSDYCSVVYPKEYEAFRLSTNRSTIGDLKKKNIEFDLVVQDEASKASPPELALPCLYGKKAVVIGDHRQLPPMVDTSEFIDNLKMMSKKTKDVKNKSEISDLINFIKRNKDEFSVSHFEKLFNGVDKNLKSSFNIQYRMHPAINETIKQFYIVDGGLDCGIPIEIADAEDMSHPLNRYHGVTANKKIHVIWLDVASPEIRSGTSRVNYGEVQAIDWLLSCFRKSPGYKSFVDYWPQRDVEQKQIGVITFYGAQAGLLNKLKEKYPEIPLRISPVDRFQGMERNIIIVSLVRSNCIADFANQAPNFETYPDRGYPNQESLGFAEFPNRLNVALSRAKRLLIIVGNSHHFRKHEIYNKVYETILQHPNGTVKIFDAKSPKK
jgi:DNA polymerase alpha-associated DNA helicase A